MKKPNLGCSSIMLIFSFLMKQTKKLWQSEIWGLTYFFNIFLESVWMNRLCFKAPSQPESSLCWFHFLFDLHLTFWVTCRPNLSAWCFGSSEDFQLCPQFCLIKFPCLSSRSISPGPCGLCTVLVQWGFFFFFFVLLVLLFLAVPLRWKAAPICARTETSQQHAVYVCNLFTGETKECGVACPNISLILTAAHGFVTCVCVFTYACQWGTLAVDAALNPRTAMAS